ncbi:hypothetical protein [Microcoleus sp.]|uniref:hypothetical protein n=1 Tax=Microcoleus sp. TaxID=44472 RepID=UPI003525D328
MNFTPVCIKYIEPDRPSTTTTATEDDRPFPKSPRQQSHTPGNRPLFSLTESTQTFSANLKTFFPKPLKSKVL